MSEAGERRDERAVSETSEDVGHDDAVGSRVPRREDEALLTGRAEFTDDTAVANAAHLAFVRSDHGHARIENVDVAPALERDGVLAAYTWRDVAESESPGRVATLADPLDCDPPAHPLLADDRVRYEGQPIAAVVAEDRATAHDAARAVAVDYEVLDAVVDPAEATAADAPTVHDEADSNVAVTTELGDEDATTEAFTAADRAVDLELENNRLQPTPMEPRAAVADYDDGRERLTVRMTAQNPHSQRRNLANALGLAENRIRVVMPSVGGGFGQKNTPYPGEAVTAWAAMRLGRPVKWTATRREHYRAGNHGRDHRTRAELAVDDDGTIRGLRVDTHAALGGYALGSAALVLGYYGELLASQYDIPTLHVRTRVAFTNTAPVHTYRGGGSPQAVYVPERLVDAAARELDLDPVTVRRRNLVSPDAFPHETAVGATYDSGDYETTMDVALDAAESETRRTAAETDDGRLRGVGVANYVESAVGAFFESGVVRVQRDGSVVVEVGTHSHGQGHATTYAQVVADELGVPMDAIEVVEGDTDQVPQGSGTYGSRSMLAGGNAVRESASDIAEQVRRVAGHVLDTDPDSVTIEDGECHAGSDDCSLSDVASTAYGPALPDDIETGLEATSFDTPGEDAVAFGTHVACVAVDPETGEVEVQRYVTADDCGERINPTIVEGQVVGGVAQGIGQARYEQSVYADDGTLETGTMLDYAVPRAFHVPDVETNATVTPSPVTELGVKGAGEIGTVAAPPALVNAVVDALSPLGVDHVDMPLTDETVWRAIQRATGEQ
jgi:carbon-monoxide dehydrogenase large subunit